MTIDVVIMTIGENAIACGISLMNRRAVSFVFLVGLFYYFLIIFYLLFYIMFLLLLFFSCLHSENIYCEPHPRSLFVFDSLNPFEEVAKMFCRLLNLGKCQC